MAQEGTGELSSTATVTLQSWVSRKGQSVAVSSSRASVHRGVGGWTVAGCRGPEAGRPAASLWTPLCSLNLGVIPFPRFSRDLAWPLPSRFRGWGGGGCREE